MLDKYVSYDLCKKLFPALSNVGNTVDFYWNAWGTEVHDVNRLDRDSIAYQTSVVPAYTLDQLMSFVAPMGTIEIKYDDRNHLWSVVVIDVPSHAIEKKLQDAVAVLIINSMDQE